MQTNIPIGLYHPSIKLPESINPNDYTFFVGSDKVWAKEILEFYPAWNKALRTYVYNGKGDPSLVQEKINSLNVLAQHSQSGHPVQIVLNELFLMDGNLRRHLTFQMVSEWISALTNKLGSFEIIINEMNPYHLLKYTGNGFQYNGVIPFIHALKQSFPNIEFSLGIQTIGNHLCRTVLLQSLQLVLSRLSQINNPYPIHFTEIGYYHFLAKQTEQVSFIDQIITLANQNDVASLCFIFPWDGDNFHLAGQPKNTWCGIWNQDWQEKYTFS